MSAYWLPCITTALLAVTSLTQNVEAAARDYSLKAVVGKDSAGQPELSFTVLQIPDMHYTGNPKYACNGPPHKPCGEYNMTDLIDRLVDHVQPNLVVFTGDQVENTGIKHARPYPPSSMSPNRQCFRPRPRSRRPSTCTRTMQSSANCRGPWSLATTTKAYGIPSIAQYI